MYFIKSCVTYDEFLKSYLIELELLPAIKDSRLKESIIARLHYSLAKVDACLYSMQDFSLTAWSLYCDILREANQQSSSNVILNLVKK